MPSRKLELPTLILQFEVHNRSEGKSQKTVGWYNEALGLFHRWLQEEGMSCLIDDLGEEEARQFVLYVQTRKGNRGFASSTTVNNRVRALRAFFSWLHSQGYTKEHRLEHMKPPKFTKKVKDILTGDEIDRILRSMNQDTVLGARNTAMVTLMLDTGLRLAEVVRLEPENVHLEDRYLKVLGKGNKERVVAFGANCQRTLIHYDYHYRFEADSSSADAFFLSIDGYPMQKEALKSIMRRLADTSGVPRLHAHLLRHTYATQFLIHGGDPFLLKQNLGHTTWAMVEQYIHLADQHRALMGQRSSPLDNLKVAKSGRSRHRFNFEDARGRVYPNAGKPRSKRKK